jgi:hypothetical protein
MSTNWLPKERTTKIEKRFVWEWLTWIVIFRLPKIGTEGNAREHHQGGGSDDQRAHRYIPLFLRPIFLSTITKRISQQHCEIWHQYSRNHQAN